MTASLSYGEWVNRFHSYYKKNNKNGCWEWQRAKAKSFGHGLYSRNQKTIMAHRASWEIHCGKIPDKKCVLHKCDNPICVNPNHLFLGSRAENVSDMVSKKRNSWAKGEAHGKTRLSGSDVSKIYLSSMTAKDLSKRYKIGETTVYDIKKGKTWAHVTQNLQRA